MVWLGENKGITSAINERTRQTEMKIVKVLGGKKKAKTVSNT